MPANGPNGAYTLDWDEVTAATKYRLQEQFNGGTWTTAHDAAGTSKVFTGKAAGTWRYQVEACNPVGCGPPSAAGTVTVVYKPASAPPLTVPSGDNTTGSYDINWDSVGTATRYELDERLSGDWVQIHNASTRTKSVTGKTAGTWSYRVRACNLAGCSANSATRTVTVIPEKGPGSFIRLMAPRR